MSLAMMNDVHAAGAQVMMLERQLAAAVRGRDAAVRAAVAGGESQSAVAREAGISRARVQQILAATA